MTMCVWCISKNHQKSGLNFRRNWAEKSVKRAYLSKGYQKVIKAVSKGYQSGIKRLSKRYQKVIKAVSIEIPSIKPPQIRFKRLFQN